jgi:Kae1-associated kinase Bud32
MNKFYKKGAEAELKQIIFDEKSAISKKRIPKGYRNSELDFKIRKKRTKSEAKILRELFPIINVPSVLSVDEKDCEIIMDFVEGKQLKEVIEKKKNLCVLAGKEIKKIHAHGIIHGDLTTSNIIFDKKDLVFIDFGLGYYSKKVEDRATDLVVFKKTFNATHSSLKNGWEMVMQGYNPNQEMISRMTAIEKRARYH